MTSPTANLPAVAITGLGLWLPGYGTARAFAARTPDGAEKPAGAALDRVNRRRAGPLARALADVIAEAAAAAGADLATMPTVVGSAIGEGATMMGLLEAMWAKHLPMSPAEFTVSVHNAAAGLISIGNRNRGMTTSLAADADTPAVALLEGIGLVLTRGTPVVVACADEPAPPTLAHLAPPWSMLAAAVVLAPCEPRVPALAEIQWQQAGEPTWRSDAFDQLATNNPQIGLAWLVDAVQRGIAGTVALDAGTGRGHVVQLRPRLPENPSA